MPHRPRSPNRAAVACVTGLSALSLAGCAVLRPECTRGGGETNVQSAVCVVVADGRLLTIRHRFGGKLGLPGGTAHAGESATCTARRETWEETGYEVRVTGPIGPRNPRSPIFRCELLDGQEIRDRTVPPLHALPEVLGIYWMDPDDLRRDDWRFPDDLDWLPDAVRAIAGQSSADPGAGP